LSEGEDSEVLSVEDLVGKLEAAYGVSEWWPRESLFEVAVGAILTQRTSWKNVQVALSNLKTSGMMSPAAIVECPETKLHDVLRPSGFYRQKSKYVRAFSSHVVDEYDGCMDRMGRRPIGDLRNELLDIEGIGPETADTIMLYALGMPSFVVDSYSFKLLSRLGIYSGRNYAHVKTMVEKALGLDAKRLSSAHAAIVTHCKDRCRSQPLCVGCPLGAWCPSESHDDD